VSQNPYLNEDRRRNPETYAVHRRETRWQIWLPIGLTITVLILLTALIAISGYSELSQWAAAALILLIVPVLIVGLIVLAINFGWVYLFTEAYSRLSPIMFRGQEFIQRLENSASGATDKMVEPFIKVRQLWARVRAVRGKRAAGI
jgi:uncharacterized membrane protein YhdT